MPWVVATLATTDGGSIEVHSDGSWTFTGLDGVPSSGGPTDKVPSCSLTPAVVPVPVQAPAPPPPPSPVLPQVVVPLTIYGTTSCPRTKRARAYFEGRGLPYAFGDLADPTTSYELFKKLGNPPSGATAIPVIDLNGAIYVGWDQPTFDAAYAVASHA
jgi:glutaredoxin